VYLGAKRCYINTLPLLYFDTVGSVTGSTSGLAPITTKHPLLVDLAQPRRTLENNAS